MADFNKAFQITNKSEGGYANNKADHGGETYAGIARNFWGDWDGWKAVDEAKKMKPNPGEISRLLNNSPTVQSLVKSFYLTNFWNPLSLSQINDQQIANNVYDCAVNSGTGYAARVLQKAAGVVADGIIGKRTLAAVNEDEPKNIYDSINAQRLDKYNKLALNPGQGQFLKSWKSRLIPYI